MPPKNYLSCFVCMSFSFMCVKQKYNFFFENMMLVILVDFNVSFQLFWLIFATWIRLRGAKIILIRPDLDP